jgi:hypothetical protein
MRTNIGIIVCLLAVAMALYAGFTHQATWAFAMSIAGGPWLLIGAWLGGISLNKTHRELMQAEVAGRHDKGPIPRLIANGGIVMSLAGMAMSVFMK